MSVVKLFCRTSRSVNETQRTQVLRMSGSRDLLFGPPAVLTAKLDEHRDSPSTLRGTSLVPKRRPPCGDRVVELGFPPQYKTAGVGSAWSAGPLELVAREVDSSRGGGGFGQGLKDGQQEVEDLVRFNEIRGCDCAALLSLPPKRQWFPFAQVDGITMSPSGGSCRRDPPDLAPAPKPPPAEVRTSTLDDENHHFDEACEVEGEFERDWPALIRCGSKLTRLSRPKCRCYRQGKKMGPPTRHTVSSVIVAWWLACVVKSTASPS